MLIIIKISFWKGLPRSYRAKLSLYLRVHTHTHTHTSLTSAIKERRKRKCLVAMIFLNWVNSKHAQSKMKINDYLFLATLFLSPHGWQRLTLKQNKIKMALSLQSFNFPQIWSKFSEHTQKTAVLHKWKSILLSKARARNICVCFYSMGRSFCIVRSY